jgi:hypothetical protein
MFLPRLPDGVTEADRYWLAGLLEGEGSFFAGPPSQPHLPVLSIQETDEDVVGRVGDLLGRKIYASHPKRDGWKTTYQLRLVGSRAVAWMTALRPLMGRRRREQIDRALASYAPRDRRLLDDRAAQEAPDLLAGGWTIRAVAERFGTSVWCMYDLRLGRTPTSLRRAV